MKYDRITIAIENGGVLTTSKSVHGIASTMHWKGQEPICGDRCSTFPDALNSLNTALEENDVDVLQDDDDDDDGYSPIEPYHDDDGCPIT